MGAFDRLQNYSASNKSMTSEVFDVKTPQGCFLAKLHAQRYKMYEYYYEDSLGRVLSEEKFEWLPDEEKVGFEKKFKYTELHNMLTTAGDQLVLANAGSGKALVNDTKVLTPSGYRPIGELKVGDKVFGTDLQLHDVLGVYPQGRKKVNVMTIECDDSAYQVNCCDEHLWAIQPKSDIEVISTKDIKRRLENVNSLPLVDVSPFEFDMYGDCTLSEFDKSRLFVSLFEKLYPDVFDGFHSSIGYRVGDTLEPCCYIYLNGHEDDYDFLEKLNKYLGNDYVFLDGVGEDSVTPMLVVDCYTWYKEELYEYSKVDNLTEKLFPIISLKEDYALRVFNGKKCMYRVTKVEEIESEVDMTCIEVGSDNHLFLIEHLIPTHNTTALIFKIMHDIITGEATKMASIPNGNTVRVVDDIFVGTFLKTGADELAERLAYWQRGLGYTVTADRVNFSTLHAEFKRALNTMGAATPIGKPADITKCMKKAVDNLGITRDGSALTAEDYNVIGGIITYYRGRLDNKKYNHPSAYDYGLTPTLLDRLVSDFANQRQLAGIMDFEDLQELLYKFLYVTPNKAVQDFCANRYKYIYLDEFQDTSQIQYAIIKFYARGRLWMNRGVATDENSPLYTGAETLGKIVVVGDNDQCLYQWRGSDNAIIEELFEQDFKPCHSSLSYNYRCPANILNAIVPSIKTNKGHERREYHASREGGIVRGYHFTSYKGMLNQLVADIDEDMQEDNTVAVLCRTNYDGVIPAFILEANKHYDFSISGQNMTFDSPLPRKLIAVTSLFTERSSPAVKNTLSMFVPRYSEWGVKQLVDTLKNNGKNVWQILEADIEYSCPELAPMIKQLKSMFYENGKRNQKKEIEALRFTYHWIMINTFGGSSLYCESARAYIEALLYLIDNNEFESVFDFLDYVNTLNEKLHARINNQKAKICIATVHEFKGKERDSVIVWNDSDGVFPSSKTDINNEEELEGERMVHYVACTRAKKKNTIYTIFGKEGTFVKEMDLQFESPQQIGGTLGNKSSNKELTEDEKNLLEVMENM